MLYPIESSVKRLLLRAISDRRLVLDDEQRVDISENMVYLATGSLLLHRLHFRYIINGL